MGDWVYVGALALLFGVGYIFGRWLDRRWRG